MKKISYIILLSIIALILTIFVIQLQNQQVVNLPKPRYHFFFIGQNEVDPFWQDVRKGVIEAAKELNVVVEFYAPRFNNQEKQYFFFDAAINANVDGIISYVYQNDQFLNAIKRAYEKKIPIVTIENDAPYSYRQIFIGSNNFELGQRAARLLVKATKGKANIAIISNNNSGENLINQNLRFNGLQSIIKSYPSMNVVTTITTQIGVLSAEEATDRILKEYPEVNAIYTMNSIDTMGVAQTIIDNNRVGDITIVGYGGTEGILDYIEKGIIYGTVTADAKEMGYQAIKALVNYKDHNNSSTYIQTSIESITTEGLKIYREKIRQREEEK